MFVSYEAIISLRRQSFTHKETTQNRKLQEKKNINSQLHAAKLLKKTNMADVKKRICPNLLLFLIYKTNHKKKNHKFVKKEGG